MNQRNEKRYYLNYKNSLQKLYYITSYKTTIKNYKTIIKQLIKVYKEYNNKNKGHVNAQISPMFKKF